MINKLWQWLNQPYPYEKNWKKFFRDGCVIGLFVALFLFIFRPFGLGSTNFEESWFLLQCFYFGLATAVMTWLQGGISFLFPDFYNEANWVIWRELFVNFLILFLITAANIVLGHYLYDNPFSAAVIAISFRNTFLIGLFPILFASYSTHQRWNSRYEKAAQEANNQLTKSTATDKDISLQLSGENQSEVIQFQTNELLFIEAADNYAKVVLWQNEELKHHLLRSTLKALEDQLATHEQFFRCHRTYLVNLKQVQQITGNAQGYKLHFAPIDQLVPVSRKLNQEINDRLPNL